MSAQHTPGPWACFYKPKYDEWHVSVPMSEGSMKWALFDDGIRSENPEADARLIAAAPDMLAALRSAVVLLAGACVHSPELEPHETYEAVSAAIAKATGAAS